MHLHAKLPIDSLLHAKKFHIVEVMNNGTKMQQLPEAMHANKRGGTGVGRIERNGVWVLSNDTSGLWKLTVFIGVFALFGIIVIWWPEVHMPPIWFLLIMSLLMLAFSSACFWISFKLKKLSKVAARIDPHSQTITFTLKQGKAPVTVPISSCYIRISQLVVARSRVGSAPASGNYSGWSRPKFVEVGIGKSLSNNLVDQQATVAMDLPYEELADGLEALIKLGSWAGIRMCEDTALREVVMTQVRYEAQGIPIFIPRKAAACMSGPIPYRVFDP